ncbi:MAG: sulfate permease, partial [Chloroflexi bacterium]|nr:sulfate permease [Chloroflexota bacterium]
MENKAEPPPSLLLRYLPILAWLPKYERVWLRTDLIAGLTVVALLIPEGMAYAQIAGMPPQTAFYAAPIGLLAFAIFGTSRQLVVAVSAIIATMSFATVSLIAAPDTSEFIILTAALAVLAGLISILAGFLKLGRVAQFFSESVMVGFITGLALVVMVKQIPKLLGIEGGSGNFWERLYEIIIHLPETHLATLITGVLCLILLIALEHYFHKIPAALVALVFGILISVMFGLEARGVEIVGAIPAGLAPPKWPAVGLQNWLLLLPGAVGLALVNFAEAIGPSRSFASAHKYKIDANQELIGLGSANFGAGLFQGFPIGSSLSKSAANDRAGAHSQMSGIIAAAITVVVALFFTQFFYALPEAALGAIVIVAVTGMVKVAKIRHLYRVRRADFVLALVALLAVLTFETLEALLIAVIVSLFALVLRASQPRLAVLGRAPKSLQFSDIRRHPENITT